MKKEKKKKRKKVTEKLFHELRSKGPSKIRTGENTGGAGNDCLNLNFRQNFP